VGISDTRLQRWRIHLGWHFCGNHSQPGHVCLLVAGSYCFFRLLLLVPWQFGQPWIVACHDGLPANAWYGADYYLFQIHQAFVIWEHFPIVLSETLSKIVGAVFL
jgi:hypothetical protein